MEGKRLLDTFLWHEVGRSGWMDDGWTHDVTVALTGNQRSQRSRLFCMNETDRSVFRLLQMHQPQKKHTNKDFKCGFLWFFFSVFESNEWSNFSFHSQNLEPTCFLSQRRSTRGWMCWSVCQWRCSARLHPSVAAVFTHVWTNLVFFFAAKSFLIFSQKEREKSENTFLQLSHTVKWNHTQILGVNCPSFALLSLFLSPSWQVLFCKYQMQLHCKQSAGMLCD